MVHVDSASFVSVGGIVWGEAEKVVSGMICTRIVGRFVWVRCRWRCSGDCWQNGHAPDRYLYLYVSALLPIRSAQL